MHINPGMPLPKGHSYRLSVKVDQTALGSLPEIRSQMADNLAMPLFRASCLASPKMHYRHPCYKWLSLGHRLSIGIINPLKVGQNGTLDSRKTLPFLHLYNLNILSPAHPKARLSQIRFRSILRFLQQLKGLRRRIHSVDVASNPIELNLGPSRKSKDGMNWQKTSEVLHEQVSTK